jgi:hypothetical protein
MTDAEEVLVVDHYNNVAQYTPPEYSYFGVATDGTVPDTEAGTGITEPNHGSYARIQIRGEDFWGDAQLATDGVTYQAQNVEALEFTNVDSAPSADIKYIIEWNTATGTAATDVRRIWTITTAITPTASQTFRVEACALKMTISRSVGAVDVEFQDVVAE